MSRSTQIGAFAFWLLRAGRRPCRISRSVELAAFDPKRFPKSHLLSVANFVRDDLHMFGAKRRIAGLQLMATDMDWPHGHGGELTGPAGALVMMMAGRLVALDNLSCGGKADLATTL